MSSWGHEIRALTAEETDVGRPWTCTNGKRCPGRVERKMVYEWNNTEHWYWDGAPALYTASYRYVTGRAGRTTYRDLRYCQPCAEKFVAKHGLALPETVESGASPKGVTR